MINWGWYILYLDMKLGMALLLLHMSRSERLCGGDGLVLHGEECMREANSSGGRSAQIALAHRESMQPIIAGDHLELSG